MYFIFKLLLSVAVCDHNAVGTKTSNDANHIFIVFFIKINFNFCYFSFACNMSTFWHFPASGKANSSLFFVL